MHDVYLGLGTNLGDRGENLENAIKYITKRIGEVISISAFYVTEPVGFESANQFLNAAIHIRTKHSPVSILHITQEIEQAMGRHTKSAGGVHTDRIIDIDLLLYDDLIFASDELTLPHPHLHERDFVLMPLSEIAAARRHPLLGKTIEELKELYKKNNP
ncbi:2-amino-4-hydroxy-6-hydroxymethyldihydropteridine diphosphokinase [Dysgonomonas sp. 511]|uniref:2-amino-4-hydroxy-6- hydroxymethyldihydropteridine diphosphokinase n=1 Tax=Dysgonomonas sp. 511 TaxID=2302930 RepID=UPI0016275EBA|nr:2-amino-4-hydroxy-6-hydroxymethyldihydropteridine diphosphokinase [Dysgonomonas sp. 511]